MIAAYIQEPHFVVEIQAVTDNTAVETEEHEDPKLVA